jgi:hypothetical protein
MNTQFELKMIPEGGSRWTVAGTRVVKASRVFWRILAAALLLLPPLPLHSESAAAHSKFAGVYMSHGEKKDPSMSLSLGTDGSATVTEDAGRGAITLFGHWVDSGDQVTVTFDPVDGKAAEPPMTFAPYHDGLQAATWNHALWGKAAPPPMKKGYKIKQKYWFTQVP